MSAPTENDPAPASPWKRKLSVSATKEFFTMLRELILVALIVFVAAWPEGLRGWMNRGDFEKLGAAGLEVSAREQARKSVQAVAEVQQHLQDSDQMVKEVGQKLSDPQKELGINLSPEDAQKLKALAVELGTPIQISETAQHDLTAARQAEEYVLQQAAPSAPELVGTWGVVVSGDKSTGRPENFEKDFEPAKYEAGVAEQLAHQVGGAATALYDRQGWFRTVIEFASNKDAQAALPNIRKWKDKTQGQRYASAYVVNIDEWCQNRQQQPSPPGLQITFYKCPGS